MIRYRKMEQHYSKQTINLWLCHYHELLSYMMSTLWHFYKLWNYQNLCYHWSLESTNLFKALAYFLFNLIANSQMCVYYCQRTSDPQKGYWSPPTNGDWVKFLSRKNGFGLPWIDLATLQVLVGGGGGMSTVRPSLFTISLRINVFDLHTHCWWNFVLDTESKLVINN